MKRIMLVFGIIYAAVLAEMRIYGVHQGYGEHECGPNRWETITQNVFPDGGVIDAETSLLKLEYAGVNTLDEKENTAWCVAFEDIPYANIIYGLAGLGLSGKVYGIEILPGYTKSNKLFNMNSRPKKILIEVFCGETPLWGAKDIIAYSKEIILKDERSYQKFMFNGKNTSEIIKEYCLKNGINDYVGNLLRLTMLEVYKGAKYDDTCISEVRFLGKKGNPMKVLPNMK